MFFRCYAELEESLYNCLDIMLQLLADNNQPLSSNSCPSPSATQYHFLSHLILRGLTHIFTQNGISRLKNSSSEFCQLLVSHWTRQPNVLRQLSTLQTERHHLVLKLLADVHLLDSPQVLIKYQ